MATPSARTASPTHGEREAVGDSVTTPLIPSTTSTYRSVVSSTSSALGLGFRRRATRLLGRDSAPSAVLLVRQRGLPRMVIADRDDASPAAGDQDLHEAEVGRRHRGEHLQPLVRQLQEARLVGSAVLDYLNH